MGRESQGSAERFLPLAGVFTHVQLRPPGRGCGPASQFRAGRGARLPAQCPVTGPPAEVVRGCGIRSAHKVSPEGLPRTESCGLGRTLVLAGNWAQDPGKDRLDQPIGPKSVFAGHSC